MADLTPYRPDEPEDLSYSIVLWKLAILKYEEESGRRIPMPRRKLISRRGEPGGDDDLT